VGWSRKVERLARIGDRRCDTRSEALREVSATSTSAEDQQPGGDDLVPLDELIRQTPGAHPIESVDELRCDAFESDEELDEFLAFVTASRHADLA
jgi:hypothetical protein